MKLLVAIFFIVVHQIVFSQQKTFIKLVEPSKQNNIIKTGKQFIIGSTCKTCNVTINNAFVKVYPTGAFAYEINLKNGDSSFIIQASSADLAKVSKKISYTFPNPKLVLPIRNVDNFTIETFPQGNLILQAGDKIKIKVKGMTGCKAMLNNIYPMYEMPGKDSLSKGLYQCEYIIKPSDSFSLQKFSATLTDINKKIFNKETKNNFSVLPNTYASVAITKSRLAFLQYGLEEDRLGAAKMGYIDSLISLHVTGKFDDKYRVQLSKNYTAYIPDNLVNFLPQGAFTPAASSTNFRISGDEKYDYVAVDLTERVPYQSIQLINPSKIVVDIFGATTNTNWVTQLENAKEIKNVFYEQKEDDVLRITVELKHQQHWGHSVYYSGNTLMLKIKQQPQDLSLQHLTIAIDAGHGGSNDGAQGATGIYEKQVTLAIALKLQKLLLQQNSKTIMTRNTERFFDNKERILFYRDSLPDLLVSIHLNSAEDPFQASGTSTYYKHIGFKKLSWFIYKRMLELGLKERGNTGNFNFMLNSPTEFPNALVETLFISNLDDETKALDENFQQQIAEKIVQGIKDFLDDCKNEK